MVFWAGVWVVAGTWGTPEAWPGDGVGAVVRGRAKLSGPGPGPIPGGLPANLEAMVAA